uniref:Uncharacterized protein n=1 Tax=Glossina brevipalpis TaxID=37001 RepID=A0A1A9W624_9MUSC
MLGLLFWCLQRVKGRVIMVTCFSMEVFLSIRYEKVLPKVVSSDIPSLPVVMMVLLVSLVTQCSVIRSSALLAELAAAKSIMAAAAESKDAGVPFVFVVQYLQLWLHRYCYFVVVNSNSLAFGVAAAAAVVVVVVVVADKNVVKLNADAYDWQPFSLAGNDLSNSQVLQAAHMPHMAAFVAAATALVTAAITASLLACLLVAKTLQKRYKVKSSSSQQKEISTLGIVMQVKYRGRRVTFLLAVNIFVFSSLSLLFETILLLYTVPALLSEVLRFPLTSITLPLPPLVNSDFFFSIPIFWPVTAQSKCDEELIPPPFAKQLLLSFAVRPTTGQVKDFVLRRHTRKDSSISLERAGKALK